MPFTIDDVSIKHGETYIYAHCGHRTLVIPVLLAAPYRNVPDGKIIGKVQTRQFFTTQRQQSATFTHDCAVLGHDYEWLVREFKENDCVGRQARLNRIQPGREYCVTRTFGYLAHHPCVYEGGVLILVKAADTETITTSVTHAARTTQTVRWKRQSFEALVDSFAIVEQEHEAVV